MPSIGWWQIGSRKAVASGLRDGGRAALRVGRGLEKLLSEDGPVQLQAAYAQLRLSPWWHGELTTGGAHDFDLVAGERCIVPKLAGVPVGNVQQRMNVLAKRYGDRFSEMLLNDFVRGKPKIAETVDLLVLRSTEIDSQLESIRDDSGFDPGTLKLIRVALHKLRGIGFKEAVIVTDHGFFLNAQAEAGDVCVNHRAIGR